MSLPDCFDYFGFCFFFNGGRSCLISRHVFLQASATGQDLYNVITEHLGLTETIFFGLMIIKGD